LLKKNNSRAICYVAFGDLYLSQALLSIKSLKKFDNQTKIVLLTNINFDISLLKFWNIDKDKVFVFTDSLTKNRDYKINIDKYADAEKVAYIDSDTIILSSIKTAWDFLNYFDICFKFNPVRQKKPGKGDFFILDGKHKVSELPHFNGGMFFFRRNEKTYDFFRQWDKSFKFHKSPYDQISLNEALFKSNIRILPLTAEWNYFPDLNYYRGKLRNPIILHYTNRISYVIEEEIMKIATIIGLDKKSIKEKITKRRKERCQKIGRLEWLKMKFVWFLRYNQEKKKLKFE